MFDGFEPFNITTQASPRVDIVGLKSGDSSSPLPPLLLLHGYPQTHHMWHRVAPQLREKYTLVIPDLRGYGGSSKPGDLASYAKSAMARDLIAVMDNLGFDDFFVCSHDRGARVAHKLCVDHPERVRKVIFLDICPTLAMYEKTNEAFAKAYWHWFFLIQPEPLPETLISAAPRKYIELATGGLNQSGANIFDKECFENYAKVLEDPAAVHSTCNDYRAGASLDMDESRQDLKDGRLIKCPVTIIWGSHGVIEKMYDAVAEWRAVTDKSAPVDGFSVASGHFIPEEVPNKVVEAILERFI